MENKNKQIVIAIVVVGLISVGASAMFLKEKKNNSDNLGLEESNNKQANIETQKQSEEADSEINPETEKNSDQGENSEIVIIEKYYSSLSDNNLEEAYQMRSDQTVTSYNKFKGWYEDAEYLKPYDFNKTSSSSYKFYMVKH